MQKDEDILLVQIYVDDIIIPDFKHKSLIPSRDIIPDDLVGLDIVEPLKDLGLLGLFDIESFYYPEAIKMFYANLIFPLDISTLSSYVYGKHIVITSQTINALLGSPHLDSLLKFYESGLKPPFLNSPTGHQFLKAIALDPVTLGSIEPALFYDKLYTLY